MIKKTGFTLMAVFLMLTGGIAWAEDVDIFGGTEINVPPNVLIIFDNSGSMDEPTNTNLPETPYVWSTVYSGSFLMRRIYYWSDSRGTWLEWEDIGSDGWTDSSEVYCDDAREAINLEGYWKGMIFDGWWWFRNHPCGTWFDSYRMLRSGNYLNYLSQGGSQQRIKLDLAKEVVIDAVQSTPGVRFGIMIFNSDNDGGSILQPIGASTQDIVNSINSINAHTSTPLAETLAEAGLYFGGLPSWANSGRYTSPIQYRCQKNHVIIMTDGEPTYDSGSVLEEGYNYMDGPYVDINTRRSFIGDYDADGNDPGSYILGGSDYLDDVAKYLYDVDLLDSSGQDDSGISFFDYNPFAANNEEFAQQNIITHTIGFAIHNQLLADAAGHCVDAEGHQEGYYFTTEDNLTLEEIFGRIIGSIVNNNTQFVAPVVPVNRINRTYADNAIYLGLFRPDESGLWKGNLKKYGIRAEEDLNGTDVLRIKDRYGNNAVDNTNNFLATALSCWNAGSGLTEEGSDVTVGGVGLKLLSGGRNFKTYKPGTGIMDFSKLNLQITAADLGVSSDPVKNDLLDYLRSEGIYAAGSGNPKAREWVMGDVIQSEPAVLYDEANSRNVIFVGANDGFLHCFVDDDKGTSANLDDDTVTEAWSFVPWELLPKLKKIPPVSGATELTGDSDHDYYVDGSPVVYKTGTHNLVAFGLRRGGSGYYALNVDTYANPAWAWQIPDTILGGEVLGQSWSRPRFCRLKLFSEDDTGRDVLLLTGGYDTNQDLDDPGNADSVGRAVFAVDAATGALMNNLSFRAGSAGVGQQMNYCIVSLTSYDDNNDGFEDVVYAGDLGGNLFVFEDKNADGVWTGQLIFSADNGGNTTALKKFFSAPGMAQEVGFDYVYVGSGDRERPTDQSTVNRFYAIKNTWDITEPLTDSGTQLSNETADVLQGTRDTPSPLTEEEKILYRQSLYAKYGWYIEMESPGEKIVSSPLVFDKVVYFTTFVPQRFAPGNDPCSYPSGTGTARLWAVNYKTGEAVFPDFDGVADMLTKEDRYVVVGSGIPSDIGIIVTPQATFLGMGTQGSPSFVVSGSGSNVYRYYWLHQ